MGGGGQGSSRGAVRGSVVEAAETAYTEGKAGNEAMCRAQLWSVVDSDGEVGFKGGLTGHWCGFRRRLQLVIDGSPAASKGAFGEVRTGWVESEEFVEDDLELVLCERWFHILDAVYVGQPRIMVEEGWCRPGDDFLVDLEGCPTADF